MTDLSIMTVCSGNICRSPLAEGLLRAGLAAIPTIEFSSVGAIARDGEPVTDEILGIGRANGVDLSQHHARYMTERLVGGADLLFAMARSHRRAIVELVPRKVAVTFTLREFARLAAQISDEEIVAVAGRFDTTRDKLRAMVTLTGSRRGQSEAPASPDDDDVIDPYRRDDDTYTLSASQIIPAVDQVVHTLSLAARS